MTHLLACATIALAGTVASAQTMDLIGDDRSLLGYGSMENLDGFNEFGSEEIWPDFLFEDWDYGTGAGTDIASGGASMTSFLSSTAIVAGGSASAQASFEDGVQLYSTALGRVSHGITFRTTGLSVFSLVATIEANGISNARIALRDLNGGDPEIFTASTTDGVVHFDQNFVLGPGDYSILYYAASSITLEEAGNLSGNASFDASLTLVPSVPTLALLGFGGLVASARRRT